MEFRWSQGFCAIVIALLGVVQVSCKCAPNKPCGMSKRNAGHAPVPECLCPNPNPALTDGRLGDDGRGKNPWKGYIGGPPGSNEVEVLTLDVGIANNVRSNNASLAAQIARLMNVPVSRVNVTPYSWTPSQYGPDLPVPQEHDEYGSLSPSPAAQVAFLQEDHERCDCKNEAGVVEGQGFKLMAEGSRAAVKVASDTSIMTVTQYNALNDFAEKHSAAGDNDDSQEEETPARIQLLSRDPCLVKQLTSDPQVYAKRLALLLGVPEKTVIIHPPPVKGTVGLLQLEATEERQQPTTLFAVKHCTKLPHTMSMVGKSKEVQTPPESMGRVTAAPTTQPTAPLHGPAPAAAATTPKAKPPAPAPTPKKVVKKVPPRPKGWPKMLPWPPKANVTMTAQAAASNKSPKKRKPAAPSWEVVMPNVTNITNATNITNTTRTLGLPLTSAAPRVRIPLKFSNVSYDVLMGSPQSASAFTNLIKEGLAEAASIPSVQGGQSVLTVLNPANIKLAFYPGESSGKGKPKEEVEEKSGAAQDAVQLLLGSSDTEAPGSKAGLIAEATVSLPLDSPLAIVAEKLQTSSCYELAPRFNRSSAMMESFIGGAINCTALKPSLEPVAAQQPDEQNRAWISFWTVIIEPPFAKLGGQRLLEMINTPGSEIANLLPATLAYIPGITDRSMGADNGVHEIRLPPPVETSTGFGLRSNRFEQEDLKEQAKRAKYEKDLKERTLNTRAVYEIAQAKKAVEAGEVTKAIVTQARQKFLRAARAHAEALRPPTALKAPAIMPPPRADEVESPYPPVPPTGLTNFMQVSRRLRLVNA